MRITPLGGAQELGKQCLLLEIANKKILVDCGHHVDTETQETTLPPINTLDGVDLVLISHAHLANISGLPCLLQRFPDVPIITTLATATLIKTYLFDYPMNNPGQALADPTLPPYPPELVKQVLSRLSIVTPGTWGKPFNDADFECCFCLSGQIAGAVSILIRAPQEKVMITGDFTLDSRLTVGSLEIPDFKPEILISSAVHGDLVLLSRSEQERAFLRSLEGIIKKGQFAILPVSAIGRAQEIASLIIQSQCKMSRLAATAVLVDSALEPFFKAYHELGHLTTDVMNEIVFFNDREKPSDLIDGRAQIIICAPPTLGNDTHPLWQPEEDQDQSYTILLPEPIDEESSMDNLIRPPILHTTSNYHLAIHPDSLSIAQFVTIVNPDRIVLTSGSPSSCSSLKELLSNYQVEIATNGNTIDSNKVVDLSLAQLESPSISSQLPGSDHFDFQFPSSKDDLLSRLPELQNLSGFRFKDLELFIRALTHSSAIEETCDLVGHQDHLRDLGAAVLSHVITEMVYRRLPNYSDTDLEIIMTKLGHADHLAPISESLDLAKSVLASKAIRSECLSRVDSFNSLAATALHAVIGAIYIDSGFNAAQLFIDMHILPDNKGLFKLIPMPAK